MAEDMFIQSADENFYGLNGKIVDYEAAAAGYEIIEGFPEDAPPRALLMYALCLEREDGLSLYPGHHMKFVEQAAASGDEYAIKWLETGKSVVPPAPEYAASDKSAIYEIPAQHHTEHPEIDFETQNAEILYEKAAELGNADARNRLKSGKAVMPSAPSTDNDEYEEDTDTQTNADKHTETAKKSSKQSSLVKRAMKLHDQGKFGEAYRMLKPLAEQGDADAMFGLSQVKGGWIEPNEARQWLGKAAAQGHRDAGNVLMEQRETDRKQQEEDRQRLIKASEYTKNHDYKAAIPYYTRVAESAADMSLRGQAQIQLARIYAMGGGGVSYDLDKAEDWAVLAKESGIEAADSELIEAADEVLAGL
jgi:TPR repeat protein